MSDSPLLDMPLGNALKKYAPSMIVIIFFIIGCSIGINIHTMCNAAKNSKVYNILREVLNYGLTVGITALMTLSFIRFMSPGGVPSAKSIGILFALASVITSGMTLGMFYKCADENYGGRKKTLEAFAWLSIILPFIGGFYLFMSN